MEWEHLEEWVRLKVGAMDPIGQKAWLSQWVWQAAEVDAWLWND